MPGRSGDGGGWEFCPFLPQSLRHPGRPFGPLKFAIYNKDYSIITCSSACLPTKKAREALQLQCLRGLVGFWIFSGSPVRRCLVDVVVDPVAVEELGGRAPLEIRLVLRIVLGEVVGGELRVKAGCLIPLVLIPERVAVVLAVAEDKDLSSAPRGAQKHARLLRLREDLQVLTCMDLLRGHFRVAGVGDVEVVVKAADQRVPPVEDLVAVDAAELLRQHLLVETVVVIDARLGRPADVKRGLDMGLGPLHDLAELRPVVDLIVGELLHRRPGDDQAIEVPVFDLIEAVVKLVQMVVGGVHCLVGGDAQKRNVQLERGIAQHSEELKLRILLLWHQVQDTDLKRTDVLMGCPVLVHEEQVLVLENLPHGEIILDFDWHFASPSFCFVFWYNNAGSIMTE